jgi:hypothetical protein
MDATFTEGMMQGPDGSILRFLYDSVRNEVATVAEGRAIFDTVLSVDVITPGQKSSTPRFELERIWSEKSLKHMAPNTEPSKKTYKYMEYQEQIEKFKRQEAAGDMGGTPLKMWPRVDRGLAATLMAANVYTVEQLAGISDANLDIVGIGGRELREQAKAFLASAEGTADLSALTGAVSDLKRENERLSGALALANSQIIALQKAKEEGEPGKLKDITLA